MFNVLSQHNTGAKYIYSLNTASAQKIVRLVFRRFTSLNTDINTHYTVLYLNKTKYLKLRLVSPIQELNEKTLSYSLMINS